jgi:hypothetical protein
MLGPQSDPEGIKLRNSLNIAMTMPLGSLPGYVSN